ncbi:hypothetical protein RJ53_01645 [Methanocalculus chunghsingensis]|uniref:Glutamine amidotransferase type-2 domain-containing protein n=2 Tax=Methanocalculus chunghsingensis TaxID=156457 RepID=A0A8J7W4V0_9EURY|nr:hypothetical protein [Methanocalculus chunghsingensis]
MQQIKEVSYLIDCSSYAHGLFGRCSLDKFSNDKTFSKKEGKLICVDGITFNLQDLLHKYNAQSYGDLINLMEKKYGWQFVNQLRGNFSGYIHNEKENTLLLFTDHIASKPVYYSFDNASGTLLFGSEIAPIIYGMRYLGLPLTIDQDGAYSLLSLGYMLENTTLFQEIHKLPPGNVLNFKNGTISLMEYYRIKSTPYIDEDDDTILAELDRRFSEAIRMEYRKDQEYNYLHIATLSGGLDSRTNVGYAKKLGFDPILCFCFSQSDYDDDRIAKQICSEKGLEYLFFSLDHGNYLIENVDEIIASNSGQIFYAGSAHLYNVLKKLSFQNYGLIHTGISGAYLKGVHLTKEVHREITEGSLNHIAYSKKLLKNINFYKYDIREKYENEEIFSFYHRDINCIFNGFRAIEQFTEYASPFLYIDFIDYLMRIDPKRRYDGNLYLKLINKYIPEFSEYPWEKYGLPPKYPMFILNKYGLGRALMRRLNTRSNYSMNPAQYWGSTNPKLREGMGASYERDIYTIKMYPALSQDVHVLFENGTIFEKAQVLTLIRALKLLEGK